jgi:hypothetical protein
VKAVSKPSPRTDWSLLAAAVGNVAQSRRFFPSVVTTISLLLFLPALVPGSLLAYRDSAHFYPPLYSLIRNEWLAGRVPLWNDMLNGGQPLAAMGTAGAFYPPQLLLTALLPDGLSLNLNMILHLAFAATGAYRLARQQSLSRAAATLAGISYAYGGGVLLQVYNPIFVVGSAWLVWAMLAGSWLLQGGGVRAFLLLAAALAMAVYGGDPQAAYHVGLVLAAWWWAFHRRLDGLILLAGAAALAGALAFVQVALTAEFLQGTSRAIDAAPYSIWQIPGFLMRGQTAHPASHWYDIIFGRAAATGSHYRSMYGFPFRPWQMAEFLWPGFAGPLDDRWPARLGLEDEHVWVNTPFAGMLPAISIVAACIPARRQTPTLRFWKWLFVAALTAACGSLGVVGVVRRAASLCSGGTLLDLRGVFAGLCGLPLPGEMAARRGAGNDPGGRSDDRFPGYRLDQEATDDSERRTGGPDRAGHTQPDHHPDARTALGDRWWHSCDRHADCHSLGPAVLVGLEPEWAFCRHRIARAAVHD